MGGKEVVAEVTAMATPDGVDVVGLVECVVVLDKQFRALDAVIVAFAAPQRTLPREVQAFLVDPRELLVGQFVPEPVEVEADDVEQ